MSGDMDVEHDAQRPHERLAGALARAGALGLVVVPLELALAGDRVDPLALAGTTLLVALLVFLLERRDRPRQVLVRAMLGGALGAASVPLVLVWTRHGGRLDEAYAAVGRLLTHEKRVALPTLAVVLASPAWVLLLLVRARTTRLSEQALAGALTGWVVACVAVVIGAQDAHPLRPPQPGLVALALAGGGLAGLLVGLVDRLVDRRAPHPAANGRPARALAVWALALLPPLGLAATQARPREHGVVTAMRQLAALETSGAGWRGEPLMGSRSDGRAAFYTFQIARGDGGAWCATADPEGLLALDRSSQRVWLDHTGALWVTDVASPPAQLDPGGPPPAGWWFHSRVSPWH